METIIDSIYSFLAANPPSLKLYKELEKSGNLYLIGGALREYRDKGIIQNLRDVDIIVDITLETVWKEILHKYKPISNSFGGYKLYCGGVIVDIWPLDETWAFRENIISCDPEDYIKYLPETVFLNLDSIIYDLQKKIWYDEKYCSAMEKKEIDVVLEKNPQVLLNIVRAFVLRKRYSMSFSDRLTNIIKMEAEKRNCFVKDLMNTQIKRYKKIIIESDEIEEILQSM